MLFAYDADRLPRVRMMGHIRYSQPWSHFSRSINEYVMYVIRDGEMYLRENGVDYHLKRGDFFLLEPGFQHEGYKKASCEYTYAHFTHPCIKREENDASAMALLAEKRRQSLISYNLDEEDPTDPITYLPKYFRLSGGDYRSLLHTAVECYTAREEHYKRRTSTYVHSFLLSVAHEHLLTEYQCRSNSLRKSEVIAEQLLNYLNHNYSRRITSRDIAEMYDVNFDYINRVFSNLTGSPIFSYINTLRIYNAKQLIATTDLKFTEIAYLVGIEDRYYFSKLFKKITGMSPTEYYREVRGL